jgi:hypothetical protein
VSEKEALQHAADEARKVARAAREFSRFLDEYAKYVTQPSWRERAVELHVSALNKLSAVNAGLVSCSKWVAESGKSAAAQPAGHALKSVAGARQGVPEPGEPRAIRIRKKGSMK